MQIFSELFFIFAATNILKGGIFCLFVAGIFYAQTATIICGFVPPCWSVNAPTALEVLVNGKGETVFISLTTSKYFCND